MSEMSSEMSDDELIVELKKRFDHTKQALYDIKIISKKLEDVNKKLQASEQVKSNFVSHMKNEINNPLTSILGLSQQLNTPSLDQETLTAIANSIFAEAFSLDFQLKNIFAAAELEAGESDLQLSIVDVNSLVANAVDSFSHLIREKNLDVQVTPENTEQSRMLFKTDADKLRLVICNLLSNSIEFSNPGGSIEIQTVSVDDRLLITVKDYGVGLDMTKLNQLFDRFTQLESGIQKSHKGHGLGLSITKAVVDLMDGTVSVDSSKDKGGCSVSLSLPVMEIDGDADAFSVDGNEFFFDDDEVEMF